MKRLHAEHFCLVVFIFHSNKSYVSFNTLSMYLFWGRGMGIRKIFTGGVHAEKYRRGPFSCNIKCYKSVKLKLPYSGHLHLTDNFHFPINMCFCLFYFRIVDMSNCRYIYREAVKSLSGQMHHGKKPFFFWGNFKWFKFS